MLDYTKPFEPRGLAATTSAPMNAAEADLPPGAPPYAGGPLANPPPPTPAPQQFSLQTIANGGSNHAQAWMAGDASPAQLPQQQPFNSDPDLPPGAPPYAGGPLANPKPTPQPDMDRFTWSSGYQP